MLDYYTHADTQDRLDPKRNHMPRQKMWRVDDDHSLKRMQFEAAYYGLDRDKKYPMRQYLQDWYGWTGGEYYSWRDLPRDCSQLLGLYIGEIHRIAPQLSLNPARCVGILLRADQKDIVPIRVEQASAILAIFRNLEGHLKADWVETLANYQKTRPDHEMQGAAFRLTEVGAANFCMKMVASGMIPGFRGFYEMNMKKYAQFAADDPEKHNRTEHARNLLANLKFEDGYLGEEF